jgi:hypothetical protein
VRLPALFCFGELNIMLLRVNDGAGSGANVVAWGVATAAGGGKNRHIILRAPFSGDGERLAGGGMGGEGKRRIATASSHSRRIT